MKQFKIGNLFLQTFQNIGHLLGPKTQFGHFCMSLSMKLVLWNFVQQLFGDVNNGVGSGFEFSKWGMGTCMIYIIPLKFMFLHTKSNFYETRCEIKMERVVKKGMGAEAQAGGRGVCVCVLGAAKTVAFVVTIEDYRRRILKCPTFLFCIFLFVNVCARASLDVLVMIFTYYPYLILIPVLFY